MPCFQGCRYTRNFVLKYCSTGFAVDISGWTFRGMIRDSRDDPEPLVELTTANGGLIVVDGVTGRMQFTLSPEQTILLPIARVMMDVERTDDVYQGPIWLFEATFQVKQPITRDAV